MAADATCQQRFVHYLPIFHYNEQPPIATTVVPSGSTEEGTTTSQASQAAPEHAPNAATTGTQHHSYVSLQHLSELLHNLSLPHVQLPHVQLPHPNLSMPHLFSSSAHPAFDVVETRTAFVVMADLPGMAPEDVVVEANDYYCTLTVSGTIPQPDPLAAVAEVEKAHSVGKHHRHEHGGHEHHHHHKGHSEPHEVGVGYKESAPADTAAARATEIEEPAVAARESAPEAEGSKKAPENPAAAEQNEPTTSSTAKPPPIHRHVTERRPGPFHRQFRLPSLGEVDMTGCRASMHHGLLTIVVPKNPERARQSEEERARARRLSILSSSFAGLAPGVPIF